MKSKREILKSANKRNINSLKEDNLNLYLTKNTLKSKNFSSTSLNSRKLPNPHNRLQICEDSVEITIPTPYPQNHFMLIEDESLLNSQYTHILNEKFPPRKYLKHNLTSWNKLNKNKPNKDLQLKFLNPKLNFEDRNLKRIKNCLEEIEPEKIQNLDEALEMIDKLKTKIVEYEITNNKNIETSFQYINCLKEENEFFKYKLIENYEKLNYMCEKYNIDESDINNTDEIITAPFRKKWLKKKFFHILHSRTGKIKKFREKFFNFQKFRENVLKLKGILGLERNYMNNQYKMKFEFKKNLSKKKKCFDSLRFNIFLQKLKEKFLCMKRTINLMVYMKELKIKTGYSKYFKTLKKKAIFKYFKTQATKALKIFKINSQIKKEEKIQNFRKKNERPTNEDFAIISEIQKVQNLKLNYTNYLMNRQRFFKSDKYKCLEIMKKIYEKFLGMKYLMTSRSIPIKNNRNFTLKIFFSRWKQNSHSKSLEIASKFFIRKIYFKIFLNKIRKIISFENLESGNIKKFYKIFVYKFLKNTKVNIIMKRKALLFKIKKIKQIYYKSFLDKILRSSFENPKLRFVSIKIIIH